MTETVSLSQLVPAPPDLTYSAFVTPFLLKQWLCNDCKVDARVNGRFFLTWNTGEYGVGVFTALVPGEQVAYRWHSGDDPAGAMVDVRLKPEGAGTRITLTLSGGDQAGWRDNLENLRYLLETGFDYRLMSRPMMGVYPMSGNELQTAQRRGLDTSKGVLLSGVAPGSGAEAAGLQKDDAILRIAGQELTSPTGFAQLLAPYKGGDLVEVELIRAGNLLTIEMPLTKRSLPELATTPDELAEAVRRTHVAVNEALDKLLNGVPEDALKRAPAEGEWSAYEILSHLLFSERYLTIWMWTMASGDDSMQWNDNNILQRAPLLALYATTAEMLDEFRRAQAGLVALAKAIPPSVAANKALFAQMAGLFAGFDGHAQSHVEQIRQTLAALAPAA